MPFPDLWPDQIANYRSGAVAPKDFDGFWAATLAEVRAHPLDPVLVPVETAMPVFDCFDVTFSGYGGHRRCALTLHRLGQSTDRTLHRCHCAKHVAVS